ncbi:hypothetical protein BpHYR1_013926 [Brachionus plicatilis]|uniref:Uncharacterized protein n=1 Tax=Brachionus plicatilis TaxID=10195 RepID=A0A3M7R4W5_BRAPC|nr:hypothetical protein BpHYR1_013926 [Brachionus plicatilis]
MVLLPNRIKETILEFYHLSMNAAHCNIKNCINCLSLVMMWKFSVKCTTSEFSIVNFEIENKSNLVIANNQIKLAFSEGPKIVKTIFSLKNYLHC